MTQETLQGTQDGTGGNTPPCPLCDAPRATQRRRAPTAAPVATESDALAFWLGTKKRLGFAQLHGGFGWHVRKANGQNVVGMPDVVMYLPVPGPDPLFCHVGLEIKIGNDRVTTDQWAAIFAIQGVPGSVAGVVRYGRVRSGEWTQDEAVEAIERALAR